jgi:glycosyltransferase involved in cell wall biosynthesis
MKGVSVILCCYNSAKRLPVTLGYIACQEVPVTISWEVVLVNNASTDNTSEVAADQWKKTGCQVPFRIVDQPVPGLSAAREKGINEASFDYCIFCDDDNWFDPGYVRTAYETMETHPDVAIAGGKSQAFFEAPSPEWFDRFSQSYVVEEPFLHSRVLPPERIYLAGAGMVLSKKFLRDLKTIGFSPVLTDRIGDQLMSGEDVELCLMARFLGYDIYYCEELSFVHCMTESRLTWDYFLRMSAGGHAIPWIYFNSYFLLFESLRRGEALSPFAIYIRLLAKYSIDLLIKGNCDFPWYCGMITKWKYFFRSYPGSESQRDLLSAKNKIVFILKNRALLFSQFREMRSLMNRVVRYSQNK